MLNDTSSTIALLHSRRSGKPRDMVAPGPSDAQLRAILEAAIRVPDHGKLFPWFFIVIPEARRNAFATVLETALRTTHPEASARDIQTATAMAFAAPSLVVALSSPVPGTKIPVWEQELSAGAACMAFLTAAHALGFVAGWITGWAAYSDVVRDAVGRSGERIAGFLFVGSAAVPLVERPRPAFGDVVATWGDI